MGKEDSDPIKPWFVAAEELGEFVGIRFGRLAPGKTEPEWIFLSHMDFDGIGGFAEILRKRGAELGRLSQIRYPAPPSKLSMLKMLPKFLKPREPVNFVPLEKSSRTTGPGQPPVAAAWHVFNIEETLQIR